MDLPPTVSCTVQILASVPAAAAAQVQSRGHGTGMDTAFGSRKGDTH